ncbi:MAG: tetratricopeptide repeat protein [bacterium]
MSQENLIKLSRFPFIKIGLFFLVCIFLLNLMGGDIYAQKRKKKGKNDKNEQVDPAAQKRAYIMELNKFWSFGYENYKNKQYADAAKYFWKVTELDTIRKFPKIYRYLGDSYFKLEKPDTAKIVFELGIKKYPEDAHLHRMVGYISEQTEQIESAISEYETVVSLESESVDDWRRLATLYVRADRIEDAIAAYDKLLAINPDDLEAQKNKTALIASTGDIEAVIEEKEIVRQRDPENSQVRFDLGKLYFDTGNYEVSIERFKEFLILSPNDVSALEYIGVAYQRLEKNTEAIAEFKKILEIQNNNKKVMTEISRCYKELGRFTTARTYAKRALAIDNVYGLGWIALGEVYEAAAERCLNRKGGKLDFNDKLVYEIAYQQYKRALQDLEFRNEAERHINYLQGVLPTTEDKFMHKDQKKPRGDCYSWIK